MNTQKAITRSHIKLYINKVKTTDVPALKRDYQHKVMGMISLAKLLEIITTEEYEQYFEELFR